MQWWIIQLISYVLTRACLLPGQFQTFKSIIQFNVEISTSFMLPSCTTLSLAEFKQPLIMDESAKAVRDTKKMLATTDKNKNINQHGDGSH